MDDSADLQGTIIGLGTLLVVAILAIGTFLTPTIAGFEPITLAGWVFAATLGAVATLHALVGQYDLTWGFGGVAVGWLFVLVGTGAQVLIGLFVLVVSGLYVVLVVRRRNRALAELAG
ncbi:hypothetical protein [Halovivax gelatinilyticus]|uniref:hypothetical protein n=1 Tax=Halovivax gelatinilyticus TaxID=2961597 RepID=UPI0020CA60EB|nr:hypothetical protein [Halovivax gelatinilyticus]